MAVDHLAKAKGYIEKGDDFYAKAADEIAVAKEERPELTWAAIGAELGRSGEWVRRLVLARERFLKTGEFTVDHLSGTNRRDDVTASTLSRADDQQVQKIVETMPPEARDRMRQAIWEQESKETKDDPSFQRAKKKVADRNHERDAHDVLGKVVMLLRGRVEFYGDVPLDEHERVQATVIRMLIEKIEEGLQMDDELARMLEEATHE